MFLKIGVLKKFSYIYRKTPVSVSQVAGLQVCNVIKKRHNTGVFL